MDTLLVRLKPYDPRRGHVLRRYTYAGIKFQEERGWYRVEKAVAEYLRNVREVPNDRYSPLAFDVCTEAEAKALEAAETEASKVKRSATDDLAMLRRSAAELGAAWEMLDASALNLEDEDEEEVVHVLPSEDDQASRGEGGAR